MAQSRKARWWIAGAAAGAVLVSGCGSSKTPDGPAPSGPLVSENLGPNDVNQAWTPNYAEELSRGGAVASVGQSTETRWFDPSNMNPNAPGAKLELGGQRLSDGSPNTNDAGLVFSPWNSAVLVDGSWIFTILEVTHQPGTTPSDYEGLSISLRGDEADLRIHIDRTGTRVGISEGGDGMTEVNPTRAGKPQATTMGPPLDPTKPVSVSVFHGRDGRVCVAVGRESKTTDTWAFSGATLGRLGEIGTVHRGGGASTIKAFTLGAPGQVTTKSLVGGDCVER